MPMGIGSIERTLRKHPRSSSSGDDSERGCKRRKDGHHNHHHRHGHQIDKERGGAIVCTKVLEVEKIDGIEVEDRKLEKIGDDYGGSFQEADYDMEEGEIVEDSGVVDFVTRDLETSEKDLHSDVESGLHLLCLKG